MDKVSLEELYLELFEAGLTEAEIARQVSNIMYYRYLDEIALSEALLRHSMAQQEFAAYEEFEVDLDDYQQLQNDVNQDQQQEIEQTKEVKQLQREMAEMQDKMNDLLIEKHTQPVEVEDNKPKKKAPRRNNTRKKDE